MTHDKKLSERAKAEFTRKYGHYPTFEAQAMAAMLDTFKKRGPKMNFKKPKWAVEQVVRENGLVEDVCKHGIGHPNAECLKKKFKTVEGMDIHGCDGCCIGNDRNG